MDWKKLREIYVLIEVVRPVCNASRGLKVRKVNSMSRCAPTLVSMIDIFHDYSFRQYLLTVPRYFATTLISTIGKMCDSVITCVAWMTVPMAFSPRFGDFEFVKRAWKFVSFHGLVNRSIDELQINEYLQLLRSQIIQRISFEV